MLFIRWCQQRDMRSFKCLFLKNERERDERLCTPTNVIIANKTRTMSAHCEKCTIRMRHGHRHNIRMDSQNITILSSHTSIGYDCYCCYCYTRWCCESMQQFSIHRHHTIYLLNAIYTRLLWLHICTRFGTHVAIQITNKKWKISTATQFELIFHFSHSFSVKVPPRSRCRARSIVRSLAAQSSMKQRVRTYIVGYESWFRLCTTYCFVMA